MSIRLELRLRGEAFGGGRVSSMMVTAMTMIFMFWSGGSGAGCVHPCGWGHGTLDELRRAGWLALDESVGCGAVINVVNDSDQMGR